MFSLDLCESEVFVPVSWRNSMLLVVSLTCHPGRAFSDSLDCPVSSLDVVSGSSWLSCL